MDNASLKRIELYPEGLRCVTLSIHEGLHNGARAFAFDAGQYLCVQHPNGTQVPMSIASSPWQLPTLQLLYRSDGASDSALAFDELLRSANALQLDGPFGDVTLANALAHPAIRMIAAGTGIAQVLSVASQLQQQTQSRANQEPPPTEVLWTTRISIPPAENALQTMDWLQIQRCSGASLATRLIERFKASPQAFNLIAGTPDFVYSVQDVLLELQCPLTLMGADAFSYAPR